MSERPCDGKNVNVCVAEGCYNEACLTASSPSAGSEPPAGLTEALLAHRPSGFVNSREQWVGCECGEEIPVGPMDGDGYSVNQEREDRARAAHVAAAVRAHLDRELEAAREDVARAIQGATTWEQDEQDPWLARADAALAVIRNEPTRGEREWLK